MIQSTALFMHQYTSEDIHGYGADIHVVSLSGNSGHSSLTLIFSRTFETSLELSWISDILFLLICRALWFLNETLKGTKGVSEQRMWLCDWPSQDPSVFPEFCRTKIRKMPSPRFAKKQPLSCSPIKITIHFIRMLTITSEKVYLNPTRLSLNHFCMQSNRYFCSEDFVFSD